MMVILADLWFWVESSSILAICFHTLSVILSSGLKEWEDGILAQVIARSQQEYIDRLKKNRDNNENSDSVSSNGSSNGDIEGPSTSR